MPGRRFPDAFDEISGSAGDKLMVFDAGGNTTGKIDWADLPFGEVADDPFDPTDALGAITPSTLQETMPVIDVRWFGAVGDNVADDTDKIQDAIDYAASIGGGTVRFPSGLFRISATIVMHRFVSLLGDWPLYASLTANQKGTWLVWGGAGTDTMLEVGNPNQTESMESVNVEAIGIDGSSSATVTGVSIGSNSRTSSTYATTGIAFERCVIAKCGLGMTWGSGETAEQADFIRLTQTNFVNCSVVGLRVDGNNCGDASTVDTCKFINCAPAGDPYIDLILSGYMTFRNCSGGGDGTNGKDFIRVTSSNKLTLISTQSEKMRYFVRHIGSDYQNPIELHSCIIDDDISVESLGLIVSYNSKIRGEIRLTGACRWDGYGDEIVQSTGGRVSVGASAIYRNTRRQPDTTNNVFAAGDQYKPKPTTTMFDPGVVECVRSGRNAPLWAPTTAYSGTVERSWVASTAYVVDDLVTPTWGNNNRYRCTVAGTSGATEPQFKHTGTFTDGTVTWAADGAATRPVTTTSYVLPRVDNGFVYKLITAGTSGGTDPSWPTTVGATVSDGTCLWQNTGTAALLRPIAAIRSDRGSVVPTSGYFERGSIRWNDGPDAGDPPAFECVVAGNPGTWAPWWPMPRILTRTASPVTVAATDIVLLVNLAVAGAVTCNLPASPTAGVPYTIKDLKGDAATNNITVVPSSGTIDGAANYVISTNRGWVTIVHNGSTWSVIGTP